MSEPGLPELARELARIATVIEGQPGCPFSPGEIERIKRAAALVEWLDMSGRIGKWALGLIGAIVLGISQGQRIADWLSGGGGQ